MFYFKNANVSFKIPVEILKGFSQNILKLKVSQSLQFIENVSSPVNVGLGAGPRLLSPFKPTYTWSTHPVWSQFPRHTIPFPRPPPFYKRQ